MQESVIRVILGLVLLLLAMVELLAPMERGAQRVYGRWGRQRGRVGVGVEFGEGVGGRQLMVRGAVHQP